MIQTTKDADKAKTSQRQRVDDQNDRFVSRNCHLVPPLARFRGAISSARHSMGGQKIQSTTDAGSLNTFGRNEIEVVLISSALLRIACLVILYKTCRVPDQELAADGVSGPVCGLALNYL